MDIQMRGLTKVYRGRVHALRGIDLEMGTGMFGLLAPTARARRP